MRTAGAVGAVIAGALACWLMVGTGFANYDTAYSLVWGSDLAAGRVPDYGVPVAPTPHPLATLLGILLAPLGGASAEGVVTALAYVWLGALGLVVYGLASTWFGRAAGVLAAIIVLTRIPVLSFGVRAYLDIPYVALVLAALLVEARRPRESPVPVLVLLGLAGLLRPEAWLFSGAYLLYLRRYDLTVLALAAAAPVLWALSDLLISGDPLHSLTGTQDNAEVLRRRTGLDEVPMTVPRRIGEILREPVLFGAAAGGLLALASRRGGLRLPAGAGVVAIVAFCLLAAFGLPILGRYLLLPAAILIVFCAGAVTGWRDITGDARLRRAWQACAVVTVLLLVVFTPAQVDRIRSLRNAIAVQRDIRDDLVDIAATPRICHPLAVPNHRPVPLLALYLDARPSEIVSAQLERPLRGSYLDPASERVEDNYTLDPNDPKRLDAEPPRGFEVRARNRSWVLLEHC